MPFYVVPTWDPRQVSKVGYDGNNQSYYFVVYRRGPFGEVDYEDAEITYAMGFEDPWRKITNLADLVMYSWGEIDWETPEGLYAIRMLRDDPTFDGLWGGELEPPAGVEDFLLHALDSRAITEAGDIARGHPEPPIPPTIRLTDQPVIPVPTAEDRTPPSRLSRLLRRKR